MVYNIFISHSWKYKNHYEGLKKFLDASELEWKDYSVPEDNPIDAKKKSEIKEGIDRKIKYSSCVLVPAGVYASHSNWIPIEIKIAKKYGKKIIAVEPWGSEKTSRIVCNPATHIVGWKKNSIIKAIEDK